MPNIIATEREKYADMWSVDAYTKHSPGEKYAPVFWDMVAQSNTPRDVPLRNYSVLDAGCGSGKGALALQKLGFNVRMTCDLTEEGLIDEARSIPFARACLWEPLAPQLGFIPGGKFDYVYCCDVMEHIPPTFAMLLVSRLLEVARRGVFLSISFQPDVMGAWIGQTLHQTVQPFVEWRDQLDAVGELIEARDMLGVGAFLVRAR
jgi:SAM-dependent methyltransferase